MLDPATSAEEIDEHVRQVRDVLRANGTVIVPVATLSVPLDEWRGAARRAARELGRPVRTLRHGGVFQAFLTDWPASTHERRVHDRAMREAMHRTMTRG